MQSIIEFQKVNFSYGRNEVLKDINMTVKEGDFFAIVGPNGGGKTTILRLILGLEKDFKGEIKVFGKAPSNNDRKKGYVPQFSNHDKMFPITVRDVVLQGLIEPGSVFPFYSRSCKSRALNVMEKLGISDRAQDRFGDLSGGLKQRTLIARAVISDPELILLDEPVASVDSNIEKDIYEMLVELNKTMTIVMVSHDLGFVSKYVNKVGCVNRTFVCHDSKELSSHDVDSMYHGESIMINHKCGI